MKTEKMELIENIKVRAADRPPSRHCPPQSIAFDHLISTIKKQGLLVPIFVDKDMYVTGGHYRFWAAHEAGLQEVPLIFTDRNTVTAQEEILIYLLAQQGAYP
jgi:ParB-like chromosome segregation protein Spo0J